MTEYTKTKTLGKAIRLKRKGYIGWPDRVGHAITERTREPAGKFRFIEDKLKPKKKKRKAKKPVTYNY